jgi:sporulation-control protein
MFKKIMAKMGVGSAKVDLVLNKPEYVLGETVEGQFYVEGGAVEQQINRIGVDLVLKVHVKDKNFSKVVTSIPVATSFVIHSNEKRVFPFTYNLPNNLPISRGGISYGFVTRLDIAAGVDHLDHDFIQVTPPEQFNNIIKAFDALGLREKADSGKFNGYSQEFEFFPTIFFRGQVQEVEFIAGIEEEGIRLLLEVDMPTLPFGLGEKELKREVYFNNSELNNVQTLSARIQEVIEEMLNNPNMYPASHYPKQHGFDHGHHSGGFAGAMGGFAAGMFGGMLLEDMLDDAVEDIAFGEEEEAEEGIFDDFFGGDDEEF